MTKANWYVNYLRNIWKGTDSDYESLDQYLYELAEEGMVEIVYYYKPRQYAGVIIMLEGGGNTVYANTADGQIYAHSREGWSVAEIGADLCDAIDEYFYE